MLCQSLSHNTHPVSLSCNWLILCHCHVTESSCVSVSVINKAHTVSATVTQTDCHTNRLSHKQTHPVSLSVSRNRLTLCQPLSHKQTHHVSVSCNKAHTVSATVTQTDSSCVTVMQQAHTVSLSATVTQTDCHTNRLILCQCHVTRLTLCQPLSRKQTHPVSLSCTWLYLALEPVRRHCGGLL